MREVYSYYPEKHGRTTKHRIVRVIDPDFPPTEDNIEFFGGEFMTRQDAEDFALILTRGKGRTLKDREALS